MKMLLKMFVPALAVVALAVPFASAQNTPATTQAPKAKMGKAPMTTPPSAQEVSDAKAKGMVWVNTNTKVYHKAGDDMYGMTKRGKFMTEDEAMKGGNRAAKTGGKKKMATK